MDSIKEIVAQTLESRGVLGRAKAEIRAHVILAIEEQENKNGRGISLKTANEKREKLLSLPEGTLLAHLIHEFLVWSRLSFTTKVYEPEISIAGNFETRQNLSKQLGLVNVSDDVPLLLTILKGFQNPSTGNANGANNKDFGDAPSISSGARPQMNMNSGVTNPSSTVPSSRVIEPVRGAQPASEVPKQHKDPHELYEDDYEIEEDDLGEEIHTDDEEETGSPYFASQPSKTDFTLDKEIAGLAPINTGRNTPPAAETSYEAGLTESPSAALRGSASKLEPIGSLGTPTPSLKPLSTLSPLRPALAPIEKEDPLLKGRSSLGRQSAEDIREELRRSGLISDSFSSDPSMSQSMEVNDINTRASPAPAAPAPPLIEAGTRSARNSEARSGSGALLARTSVYDSELGISNSLDYGDGSLEMDSNRRSSFLSDKNLSMDMRDRGVTAMDESGDIEEYMADFAESAEFGD